MSHTIVPFTSKVMRRIKSLFAIAISGCLFFACSGNASSSAGKDSAIAGTPTASTTATSTGDASWSCKMDGKDLSGKGTDQIVNAASVHAPGVLYFALAFSFTGDLGADLRAGGFGFEVPDKGTTVIRGAEVADYSIAFNFPNDAKNTYNCKEMTVTITCTAARVTGTFAGILIEPKTSRQVPVTDGKFNIPMSSYGKP